MERAPPTRLIARAEVCHVIAPTRSGLLVTGLLRTSSFGSISFCWAPFGSRRPGQASTRPNVRPCVHNPLAGAPFRRQITPGPEHVAGDRERDVVGVVVVCVGHAQVGQLGGAIAREQHVVWWSGGTLPRRPTESLTDDDFLADPRFSNPWE